MIQDIQPHRYSHEYLHDAPGEEDFVLAFKGKEVLASLSADYSITYPQV